MACLTSSEVTACFCAPGPVNLVFSGRLGSMSQTVSPASVCKRRRQDPSPSVLRVQQRRARARLWHDRAELSEVQGTLDAVTTKKRPPGSPTKSRPPKRPESTLEIIVLGAKTAAPTAMDQSGSRNIILKEPQAVVQVRWSHHVGNRTMALKAVDPSTPINIVIIQAEDCRYGQARPVITSRSWQNLDYVTCCNRRCRGGGFDIKALLNFITFPSIRTFQCSGIEQQAQSGDGRCENVFTVIVEAA